MCYFRCLLRSNSSSSKLVDESVFTGKGANGTISLVHYYLRNLGLAKQMPSFTRTTALVKIKTIIFFGTMPGEQLLVCTGTFCIHFWLLATLSSPRTGVLAWLSRRSEKHLFRTYSSWPVGSTTRLSQA